MEAVPPAWLGVLLVVGVLGGVGWVIQTVIVVVLDLLDWTRARLAVRRAES